MGEEVWVIFPGSWGVQFHVRITVDCNVGGSSPAGIIVKVRENDINKISS